MILIKRPETEPRFNIAAEEYAVKYINDDVVMLWQSENSVIVGKHQNTVKEVNVPFVYRNKIPVIRRISGGGTVFHSPGNLNYTLITTHNDQSKLIDFRKFTKPVMEFLNRYGIKSSFEGKNNLYVNGKKFSGNSAHIFKNRIIHHGTILFDADLNLLEKVIMPSVAVTEDKSINSVRATVANLKPLFKNQIDISGFKTLLEDFLLFYYNIEKTREFTGEEKEGIAELSEEKYNKIEWNWGYSPDYIFKNEKDTVYGSFSVTLNVSKGIISDIRLFFEGKRLVNMEKKLTGKWHEPGTIYNVLNGNKFIETIGEVLF